MVASLIHKTDAVVLTIILFLGMLVMVRIGRIAGNFWKVEVAELKGGVGSILSGLFGLSAFMLAFTFGMSGTRYSNVRNVIVDEANDIKTAMLRSDLYGDSIRDAFRSDFKRYIDARIIYYENLADSLMMNQAKKNAERAGGALWARATQQSKLPNMLIPSNQMLPALNNMLDIAVTIEFNLYARIPDLIVYMLFILAWVTSFIGGFTSTVIRQKDWVVIVVFSIFSSMVTYVTLDLGRPMRGIIKANLGEKAIRDLGENLEANGVY
jgi:hypothetical protein